MRWPSAASITYNDVAVFYRTNNSSRSLEEVFIRAGIPYKVVGGVRFYERKEIRDIVAYLRVLDNPGDAVSLRRILNTPRRGIGDRAEACVAVYAENTGSSFADALEAAAEGKVPLLNTRSAKAIAGFVEMIDELRSRLASSEGDLGELVEAVLERTGYRTELESSSDPQDLARLDNLNELVSVAHEFATDLANAAALDDAPDDEDVPDTGVLAQFLERVSLVADTDEIPEHDSRFGDADDVAHRQGAGVPGRVRHRMGRRHVPAHAGFGRCGRALRGASTGVCRDHPSPSATLSSAGPRCGRRGDSRCSTRNRASCARSRRS